MRFFCTLVVALSAFFLPVPQALPAEGDLGIVIVNSEDGVKVLRVLPNSPASEVGILPGDILVKVGKHFIPNTAKALKIKRGLPDNKDIPFTFETPGGPWTVIARFQNGEVVFRAQNSRPGNRGEPIPIPKKPIPKKKV